MRVGVSRLRFDCSFFCFWVSGQPSETPQESARHPVGHQKTHQATPREPKSHPRAAQKTTLGHQRAPKRHPTTHPKGRQRDTKRPPGGTKGRPRDTQSTPRDPRRPARDPPEHPKAPQTAPKRVKKRPQELPWIFFGSTLRKCCKYQQKTTKNNPK